MKLAIDLIVCQGRVADRAPGMIRGAELTARALEGRYGLRGTYVGTPAPATDDDWRASLPEARGTLAGLAETMSASVKSGRFPVMVANTCSASLASLPVVAREFPEAVVLWCDAHGDFNIPATSCSGYLGGMVLSAACGLWESGHGAGVRPEQVILVGARDIDPAERELLEKAGVRIIPPADANPDRVLSAIQGKRVWIHVDWDVLEPGYLPADYKVANGILPTQLCDIFRALPASQVAGFEMAEFDAPADEATHEAALRIILDTVAPIFERAAET